MKILSFLKKVYLLSFAAVIPVFSQNYEISLSLKSHNDTVKLGHYFAKGDLLIPDDTVVLKNGKGVFRGNKKLAKGVYFLINDGKRLFDFIIGENQRFGIATDTVDFVNLTKFTSSPENDVFFEFQRYNADRGKQFQQLNEQFRNAATDAEKKEIGAKMQTLQRERIEYIEKSADDNSNLYVSKFLRTLVSPNTHLPEPPRDDQGRVTDSTYVYRWFRTHYFDHLNIFDPDMLRTPFYDEKLFDFITRVIPQHPDTICAEADKILAKAQANDEIFRCILVSLFNYYAKSKVIVHENVWVHLADKWYIPYGTFSSDDYLETLKKEVKKKQPNLIGKLAPPLEMLTILPPEHFKAAALDTAIKFDLYAGTIIQDFRKELKSKYTVLLFWEYTCGGCRQTIQELFKVKEELKDKGLQVITVQAVCCEKTEKGKWIDFINEHELFGWINAWSPYSYKYKELYDAAVVPKIYLLDEDKTIILKNIVPEQLKDFINTQK